MVMTAQNGIPWWYFLKHGGPFEGRRLESVDPGGVIAAHLPVERVIASVVYLAAEIVAPGVIRHIEGNRFSLAEIDNQQDGARRGGLRNPAQGRLQGPRRHRHPLGTLDEIVGQSELQSDQRADPCDARRHLPVPAHARSRRSDDARGAGGRRGARHQVPHIARKAHRRRREPSAPTRHPCCRTSKRAGRSRPTRSSARSSSSAASSALPTPHIDAVYALVKLLAQTLQEAHGRLKIEPA